MIEPTISIILPVYNAEFFLKETLDSILNQTFKNWELIAINDGSTDGSINILKDYAAKDNRVRIIDRENKKLIATLNEGIDLARGKIVARMDSDDVALPQRLETQLRYMKDNNLDFCGTWARYFGKENHIRKMPVTTEEIEMCNLFYSPVLHPTVMGKTEFFKRFKYDKNDLHAEDYGLWSRAIVAGCKIGNVPEVLLNYRVSDTQISSKYSDIQHNSSIKIRKWYRDELGKMSRFKIPDSLISFEFSSEKDLKKSVESLILLRESYCSSSDFSASLIDNVAYRLLINASCLGFKSVLRMLRLYKFDTKQKICLLFCAIFRLASLKTEIKKHKCLMAMLVNISGYKK